MQNILSLVFSILATLMQRLEAGHGVLVTVIGLLAVFSGLLVLWGLTALVPHAIAYFENRHKPVETGTVEAGGPSEKQQEEHLREIAIAIGVALCCEMEDEEMSVLTLRNIEQDVSPWVVASRPTTMRVS
ncbi:MAG: hypothetical protein Kow0037_28000 [Calditrichia bacterium]